MHCVVLSDAVWHLLRPEMRRRVTFLFPLSLIAVDALMIMLAFYGAYRLRLLIEFPPPVSIPPFRAYWGMMIIQTIALLVIFFLYRLYHRSRAFSHVDELYTMIAAVSVGIITSTAFTSFIYKNDLDYPRLMVVYSWVLTLALVTLGRVVHARIQWALQARGIGNDRVIIVGTGEVARIILRAINRSPGLGYRVVGLVAGRRETPDESSLPAPLLGTVDELPELIEAHQADEVIIGMPDAPHEEMVSIILRSERERVSIRVFPDLFQIMAGEVSIGELGGLPLLTVRDVALRGWKLGLKRAIDVVVSAVTLVILSPLMLLLALLIKLDSPGAVFYTQIRMGLDAKPFPMLKFRSMRSDAERDGPGWTVHNDPRITRLGALIRRFSLDELPQFINVLLGEMSIVGPRPERPVYVEQFRRQIPRYMERHREKAGITGWAQINGLRGDTSIAERTKYDLWYIEHWSLSLDFKIMIKSLFRIFTDRSAY